MSEILDSADHSGSRIFPGDLPLEELLRLYNLQSNTNSEGTGPEEEEEIPGTCVGGDSLGGAIREERREAGATCMCTCMRKVGGGRGRRWSGRRMHVT